MLNEIKAHFQQLNQKVPKDCMYLQCLIVIHAPKRSNNNFINGMKIQSLDINVALIHQSMYSSYIIIKKSPVIFWLH